MFFVLLSLLNKAKILEVFSKQVEYTSLGIPF